MGLAYVQKDLFGWKADIIIESEINYDNDRQNGIQGQGENLLYCLIKHGDDRNVQVQRTSQDTEFGDVADGGNRIVSIRRIVYLVY